MEKQAMLQAAEGFFAACEAGKGWAACAEYCAPDAWFQAQAEPLLEIKTLAGYADWMQAILGIMPDARYELMAWAVDEERQKVVAAAVFYGTHTGEGGPVAPTGKSMATDYVYVMEFGDGKIVGMVKIWNAGLAVKALGWS